MKKICIVLFCLVLLFSFAACSQNENNNQSDIENKDENIPLDKSPSEIDSAIAEALGEGYSTTSDRPETRLLLYIPDLDLNKVESYVAKEPMNLSHDTIIIIKCKEFSYADEMVGILNDYLADIIEEIRDYPVGVAKVENARLFKANDTVMFIIGGADARTEEEEADLAISEYKKIDNAIKNLLGYMPQNLAIYQG